MLDRVERSSDLNPVMSWTMRRVRDETSWSVGRMLSTRIAARAREDQSWWESTPARIDGYMCFSTGRIEVSGEIPARDAVIMIALLESIRSGLKLVSWETKRLNSSFVILILHRLNEVRMAAISLGCKMEKFVKNECLRAEKMDDKLSASW